MHHVKASSVIDAPIEHIWTIVRDFGAIADWLPGTRGCQVEGDADRIGAIRRLDMGDAGIIHEQLLGLSDAEHRVDFAITESALPISGYQATIQLLPVSDGNRTFISWSARFEAAPEHAAEMTARMPRDIYQPAFDTLKQRFATRN
ncbi:SRPBCC family protein [Rhizosaccharibacter radicis]|uniref:SRPBCC family protein n=1 Tax=Rhizosaccharibacter radicis TaxID=2782605 RepID=A0ABT1VZ94_9PROT|nr:SRPBCC family protein [Acetobacteraceae bacterium KSS12]